MLKVNYQLLVIGELNLDDCVDRFGIELTGVTWRTESCIPLLSECIFTVDGDLDEQDKWFNLSVASNQNLFYSVLLYRSNIRNLDVKLNRPLYLTQKSALARTTIGFGQSDPMFKKLKPSFLYLHALYISADIEAFWYDSLYLADEIPSKRSFITLAEELLNLNKTGNFEKLMILFFLNRNDVDYRFTAKSRLKQLV